MLKQECFMEVIQLHREGLFDRHIGKRLGMDRRTVKRYVSDPALFGKKKSIERTSVIDPYKEQINQMLDEDVGLSAAWICNKLSLCGYDGSYERIKLYVRGLKAEQFRRAYIRFETEPGCQAQVDFAEFLVDRNDGTQGKYYLFVMVLGYSRMLYVELIEHCGMISFLEAHIRAFEFFGGVPREILYDRMKNVYIRKVAGKDQFNTMLVGMAVHYGFTPRVAPPYSPWVKGNGKSGIMLS
jgi:transposase